MRKSLPLIAAALAIGVSGAARADEAISVPLFPGAVIAGNGCTAVFHNGGWYGVPANAPNQAMAVALLLAADESRTVTIYIGGGSFSPCVKGQGNPQGSALTITGVS